MLANRNSLSSKLLSLVTSLALVLSFVPCMALPQVAFADAVTTISTAEQLVALATAVNGGNSYEGKTVQLNADIDLSSIDDWQGIGNSADAAFAGTFDGKGHAVTGMTIADAAGGYEGLFGNNAGTVKNVSVSGSIGTADAALTVAADGIGGVVGVNNGVVQGVTSDVFINIKASSAYGIGGVVGQNNNGASVTQCLNKGKVAGTKCVGGVVGRSYGTIAECVNTADISGNSGNGKDGIGGIAGMGGNKSKTYVNTITSCYNTGSISNPNAKWVGGIVGMTDGATTVSNCYATGACSGYGYANPLIGQNEGTAQNCYYLDSVKVTDESGVGSTSGGTDTNCGPKTATELKTADFVALLNGEGAAFVAVEDAYPALAWEKAEKPEPVEVTGISLTTGAEGVRVGDTFSVDVVATYDGNISALQTQLGFNPEVASITSITYAEGIEHGYTEDFNNETGYAKISFFGDASISATNGVTIATINFEATGEGDAAIVASNACACEANAEGSSLDDIVLTVPAAPLQIAVGEAIVFTVYTQDFDGSNRQVAKAYTMSELAKLVDEGASPIAGQYLKSESGVLDMYVWASKSYVTFEDLMDDAGAAWESGYTYNWGGNASKGANSFTYDQLQGRHFDPNAVLSNGEVTFSADVKSMVEVTPSLALTACRAKASATAEGTAAAAKAVALAGTTDATTLLPMIGASDAEIADKWPYGKPYWTGTDSITVTAPEVPVYSVSEDMYAAGYYEVTYTAELAQGMVPSMNGVAMANLNGTYVALATKAEVEALSNAAFTVAAGTPAVITRDGDINANGMVTIVDAQVAYDVANGVYDGFTKLSMPQWLSADVNDDHEVLANDARAIQVKVHTGEFGVKL